jgi:hypothetical protein
VVEESSVRERKFGVCQKTIDELFGNIREGALPIDPSPVDTRRRAVQLGNIMLDMLYEKSVSSQVHGKLQISLWNNLIEAVKVQLEVCELANISLCSEARVVKYM